MPEGLADLILFGLLQPDAVFTGTQEHRYHEPMTARNKDNVMLSSSSCTNRNLFQAGRETPSNKPVMAWNKDVKFAFTFIPYDGKLKMRLRLMPSNKQVMAWNRDVKSSLLYYPCSCMRLHLTTLPARLQKKKYFN